MTERSSLDAAHLVITGNSGGMGAGIYHRAAPMDLANSLISRNVSSVICGGIYADSCWGTIENNTIDGNSGNYGIGNFLMSSSQGCVVTNNHFTFGSPTGFEASSGANLTYTYNNAFGNPGGDVMTIVPDGTNISADPLYADTSGGDYHLAVFSAGIDAGDPSGGTDPDGSRADIGMYGGPAAAMVRPSAALNCSAVAVDDTTISVSWDPVLSDDVEYNAVFGDTASGFIPGSSNFLGTTLPVVTHYDHSPVDGCRYYKVCAVNTSGYAGGYSNEAGDCAWGHDLAGPSVDVVSPATDDSFMAGDTLMIEWIATDDRGVDSVSISYSTNAGADYTILATGEPNDSLYSWVIPIDMPQSDSCVVMVEAFDPSLNVGAGESEGRFTILAYVTGSGDAPLATALMQNYPNPFNGHTTVTYSIGSPERVNVSIYDTSGRLVRTLEDRDRPAGTYLVVWNGRDDRSRPVASGVYFMRMTAGGYSRARKIIYLR
jgi:hypothetical protein